MAKLMEVAAGSGPKHRLARVGIILVVGIILLTAVLVIVNRHPLPELKEMGITGRSIHAARLIQGDAWNPQNTGVDGDFAVVTDNGAFSLLLDPKTSEIALKDKSTGYVWRNPPKEQLKTEKVKGLLLENIESPFILEFVEEGKTQRNMTNALEGNVKIGYIKTANGVQVTYTYDKLSLSVTIQYELTEHGLVVTVPDEGIKEEGQNRIVSISVLPFFGAVSGKSEEGYLFVPDGPGGLIRFDSNRPPAGNRYDYPVYNYDPAHLQEQTVPREPISYPVFGLKRGDHAYAAIIEDGKFTAWIQALPAGMQTTFNSIGARFVYRQEFLRKTSRLGKPINSVQEQRVHEDGRVEYRMLSGGEANYAGMAGAYREKLIESGQLPKPMPSVDNVSLQLVLVGGGTKDVFGGRSFVKATTFKQAEQMVSDLQKRGAKSIQVIYQGWQASGYIESDKSLPVRKELGGDAGAKRFIQAMHDRGVKVLFSDNIIWRDPSHSDQSARNDGVRSIDSTVYVKKDSDLFLLNPEKAVRSEKRVIDRLHELGVDGIQYSGMALLFRDFNTARPLEREDSAHLYQGLLDYTRKTLGMAAVDRGNDYLLPSAGLVTQFSLDSSYDFIIDETVPFYPMVIHGLIPYSSVEGNMRSSEDEWLRAIEYGATPAFKLTYDPSRVLKGTDYDDLFSSDYNLWADRVADEYAKFNQLASLSNLRMTNHEKQEEGVYVTTYEDGTKVTVNYNTKRFDVTKGVGK